MEYKNILLEKNYLSTEEAFKLLSMTLDQINRDYLESGLHVRLNERTYEKSKKVLIKSPHMVRKFNKVLKNNDFERDIESITILVDKFKQYFIRFKRIEDDLWSYEIFSLL